MKENKILALIVTLVLIGCSQHEPDPNSIIERQLLSCTTKDGKLGYLDKSKTCKEHKFIEAGPTIPGVH